MGNEGALEKLGGSQQVPAEAGMVDVATTRAAQEVQAAMVIAKRFPRSETAAYSRVMESCHRKGLAEQATYAYPRGSTIVTGPSIRLAEVLARAWGNIDFGVIELDQRRTESDVMAYAWDLETNTRQTKIFTVPHVRYTRDHGNVPLRDPRDIYEMVANQGARRLRACVLGVIPGDVVDAAVAECEKTLAGAAQEPMKDRLRNMVAVFSELGVSEGMIEARLGHRIGVTTEAELVTLRKIYLAVRDNMAGVERFFDVGGEDKDDGKDAAERLADRLESDEEQGKEEAETPAQEPKAEQKEPEAEKPESEPEPAPPVAESANRKPPPKKAPEPPAEPEPESAPEPEPAPVEPTPEPQAEEEGDPFATPEEPAEEAEPEAPVAEEPVAEESELDEVEMRTPEKHCWVRADNTGTFHAFPLDDWSRSLCGAVGFTDDGVARDWREPGMPFPLPDARCGRCTSSLLGRMKETHPELFADE